MYDPENPDRQYAMLTSKDRNFLIAGGRGYDTNNKNNRKRSIIPRVHNSLADFHLLSTRLSEDWRREITDLEISEINTTTDETTSFHKGLVGTMAFLYLLCTDKRGAGNYESGYRPAPFWEILEAGIAKAEAIRRSETEPEAFVDVTFDVEVHEPTDNEIENVIDRMAIESASSLSGAEARSLLHAIDPDTGFYEGDHKAVFDRLQNRREEHDEAWNHMLEKDKWPDEESDNNDE